jgi:hypothetical protein
VVLSALFLCADDVILLEREKKKDYPIVSLGWTHREKRYFSATQNKREKRGRGKDSTVRTRIFLRFSSPSKHLLLLLGPKKEQNN